MAAAESEIAAKLIERLLADPAFRDRFRRDPAGACREAGLESLAEEMRLGAGKAMHTLDIRESRSSLAGVMMAAAMEGIGVYEFSKHVVPHLDELPDAVGDVLSRVNLPALPGAGALSGGPQPSAAAVTAPPAADEAEAGGNGAAPAPAAPPGETAKEPPEAPAKEAAKPPAAPEQAVAEPPAGRTGAREEAPPSAPELAGLTDAAPAEDATRTAVDAPPGSELPTGDVEPQESVGGPEPAADADQPAAAPEAPAVAPEPAVSSGPVDPSQFGQDGTGGKPDAEALALLENKNVVLDDVGVSDIKAGRIDPRIVAVLTKLSQDHKIVVSCMCSDHSKFTAGGSVSNHAFGRGLDIASIDGEIVSPGSALAREVASELSGLDAAIRPDEIGSPFAISGPGYFTDAAHSNHIHVGFKQEIAPDFKPPADVSAAAQQPAVVAAAPAAAAPELVAAAAPPPDPKRASGLFAAAEPAKVAAIGAEPAAAGDSKLFLQAVQAEQPQAQPAAVAADPAAPAAVDLSGVAAGYPGDDAPKEQIAAWMAKEADKRGLPPQLPVMAALVESNLSNVDYGDADSLGYFQMRVSIWERDYPGFAEDPAKQIDWFLDTAERVKEQRLARGQSITDPDQFGEWIADVERPAEQYRGRYQLKLTEADNLLKNAPQTTPAPPETAAPPPLPAEPIDPDQLGQDGTGGKPNAEALALLENKNVVLDDVGVADIKAGKIDPRIVAVLTKLSQDHKIVVSCMCSDHSKFTAGGSVSNHAFGRGLDIASIDGEIVSPGSALAREVASELSGLESAIRPDEIGSPFAISGPGYFTDAAHSNHIHVGFKTEITPNFKLPAELRAGGAAAAGTPGADALVDAGAVGPGGGGRSSIGAAALRVAQTQRGVRELGTNTGPQVDRYLEAAGVAPGNPWCASFVTWSLEQAGHKMPSGGWAAVATWVRNAEQGGNGLKLVSAEEARPGDIVAYDWGGGNDFGADGHIGFLDSSVEGGRFTALEGNNADAVNVVPRQLGGANVVFIRVEGDAPAGTAPIDPGQAAAAAGAAAPVAPELAGVAGIAPPPDPKRASGLFAAAQPAKVAAIGQDPKPAGDSRLFLQAVQAQQPSPQPAAAAPAADPAAAAAVDLSGVAAGYPGDDAPKEQIAAWMAKEADKRGLPPQLPVMAALVESNLSNVDYGDADSLGYFQMRVSIWERDYPGFAEDPAKQIDWFLDTAERVKEQRLARGQSITDPDQFGEWIADVERPAEQYRGRYQLKLTEAQNLLKNAPAPPETTPAAPEAPAGAALEPAPPAMARGAGPKALAALEEAKKFLGTPYKWGGSTPQTGFDCSGLVQWAYAQAGVQIPRVTHEQIEAGNGSPVRRSELLPGDLVFFRDPSGYVYHVGISMGGDKFMHAPRTGDVVKFASLDEPYYSERFTGGRRFDDGAAAPATAPAAAPAAAAAVDPVAVAAAQAAVARDAAEAQQHNSGLFKAINAQEARNHKEATGGDRAAASSAAAPGPAAERSEQDSGLFFQAITAEQAAKAKAEAARAAPPAVPGPAAAVPAAPEVAAAGPAPPEVAAGPPPDLAGVPADYPGDDAGQAELAKWLAKRAEKAGLPPELPVMAALVESGVRNLDFGDADSVGFFQMRVGIWNKGEYAGYPENPGLQAKWFIDTAQAVKRQRIAAGDAGFGKDPSTWGEWIADVERPAEQYRGRYQLRLAEARRLLR